MATQTIAVLSESELKDGQMKEVDFGDGGKVLLSRLGDNVHATSAFCTHYGAPLAKGVLTADGRVVCPWHGACFNVCTGDIEDAPAPNALHSFKASISNGQIHVTADPAKAKKDNMARPSKLLASGAEQSGDPVVVVGGGSGGFQTVEGLRENGFAGPITILTKEPYAPIDRTKLSKALITDASKLEWRTAADLKIKYGVTLRTGVEVTAVDFAKKTVAIDGGKESFTYSSLVLAPGASPRRLPIDGANLSNVYTLRGVEDAKLIDAACQEGKKLVVIGSSFISMELVAAVSKRKLASIDVIGMEEFPFELVLGKQVGAGLKKFHESQGVKFHMQVKVSKIAPSTADSGRAGSVTIDNGPTLEADVVVMGVGVGPATSFLKSSGLELRGDGGVFVDEFLRVKGQKDVYAIGDIAVYPQLGQGANKEPRRVEHWNVAGNHGRAVGKTIAKPSQPQPFSKVPVFWSAQGQQLRYCGVFAAKPGDDSDVIIKGDPGEMKFIAYYVHNNNIVAVASMQNDPVVSKASELLRLGLMPSPSDVRNGKDLLSIDISTVAAKPKVTS